MNNLPSFESNPIDEEQVKSWIKERGGANKYQSATFEPFSEEWQKNVDAPKLLDDLFQDLSETKEIYRKPLHSVALMRWLLENDPEAIRELLDYVAQLVPQGDVVS